MFFLIYVAIGLIITYRITKLDGWEEFQAAPLLTIFVWPVFAAIGIMDMLKWVNDKLYDFLRS
jgi:hypothetical protein